MISYVNLERIIRADLILKVTLCLMEPRYHRCKGVI